MLGTRLLLGFLKKRQILDIPNQRSNHSLPTPRGAGLAVIASLLMGSTVWSSLDNNALDYLPFIAIAGALAVFSFLDDMKHLPAALRFLVQGIAVAASLYLWKEDGLVFQGLLPANLDTIATAILWLWFINLYNFMDGIDGITGAETISIGLGVAAIAAISITYPAGYGYIGLMLVAAALGFLVWNWHPAKIFLGDSGSVSLGYLLGFLLLALAKTGDWQAALLLPGYYLFDSGVTLARRLLRGEKFWQAHSKHFYQQAVRRGLSPCIVVYVIASANVMLTALALATVQGLLSIWALALGLAVILSMTAVLLRLQV